MPAPHTCTACPLCAYRKQVVNGVVIGENPKLLVVGEGPGLVEDKQGRPFVGPTGGLLYQELTRRGFKDYALTNATRCYPGEDKNDTEMDKGLEACHQYLMQDIEQIKPKVILALGAYAVKALGFDDPMNTVLCHVLEGPYGIPVIPSYHPAAFMRDSGSIHLFELAVYKAMRVVNGLDVGARWPPEIVRWQDIERPKIITIDTETTSKNQLIAELVTAQVTCDGKGTVLIESGDIEALNWFEELWSDESVEKCFQNGDYDIQVLERKFGKVIQGYAWDTMLAEHLLHEETHYNLETLRGVYTDNPVYERELRKWKDEVVQVSQGWFNKVVKTKVEDGVVKSKKSKNYGMPKYKYVKDVESVERFKSVKRGASLDGYDSVPRSILHPYGVYDSQTTDLVRQGQERIMSDEQKGLLRDVVLPMQLALKDMEREGILVDAERIPEVRDYYTKLCNELAAKVFREADEEFKITSPDEVKRVLFEELGLPKPPIKSKKTGVVSSGKKALDWLSTNADHPVIHALEEWRAAKQILSNFIGIANAKGEINKGLMSHMTDANRLHTTFRMTLETGRNSSSPNLQNLPVLKKGPIRELFIAEPGNVLLQADYSQIELRIAAYESNERGLIQMLETGGDVHTYFGRRLYPYEPELSDSEWKSKYDSYRTLAKRFTFGRLFGQGEDGMALTFNISKAEALRFQDVYSELFPHMSEWWEDTIAQIRRGEPLETKWHRFRRFPAYEKFAAIQWRGKNAMFSHMDREGLNFISQGTAADCLAKATGNIKKLIDRWHLPMGLRLVVHDSLTVECSQEYKWQAASILKAEMECVGKQWDWILPVEVKQGHTWAGELGEIKFDKRGVVIKKEYAKAA